MREVEGMTTSQFLEKKERLRERLLAETTRLGLSLPKFETSLEKGGEFTYPIFKRKMLDMGFSLVDLPDDDLKVLDIDLGGMFVLSLFFLHSTFFSLLSSLLSPLSSLFSPRFSYLLARASVTLCE